MELTVKPWSSEFKKTVISTQVVNILWCADGWCYVPETRVRRQFFLSNNKVTMIQQPWEGTIPVPEYSEEVELQWYSGLEWRELSEDLDQLFLVTTTNQSTSK